MKISSWNIIGAGTGGFKKQLRIHRKRQPEFNCFKGTKVNPNRAQQIIRV